MSLLTYHLYAYCRMRVVVKMYVYTSIVLLCAAVLTSYGKMVRRWHGVDRQ